MMSSNIYIYILYKLQCWILETYFGDTDIAKLLQIGTYSNTTTTNLKRGDIIDVEQVVKQDQNKY
jgi:hypothetical protein